MFTMRLLGDALEPKQEHTYQSSLSASLPREMLLVVNLPKLIFQKRSVLELSPVDQRSINARLPALIYV